MTQRERLLFLINRLLGENPAYKEVGIPREIAEQKRLLRSLMNVRPPVSIDNSFLEVQDDYLLEELSGKGVTDIADLKPIRDNLYVWRGDITTLKVDAIVNAANSQMIGCFIPCHGCIDNAIHTYAGIQLRLACNDMMEKQEVPEPTGKAKITPAFNLPSKYVIHTVGPIISGELTERDCELLADCYRSCLEIAAEAGLESIAFCCISTGEFRFPNDRAAEIAVETVQHFIEENESGMKVIFNVFKETDWYIYQQLLGENR
ncbi:MAG: protein-ADP-ribose hydrolase [Bacillus sp. (in: firmicutes)]